MTILTTILGVVLWHVGQSNQRVGALISEEQAREALANAARGLMDMNYEDLERVDRQTPESNDGWRELSPVAVGDEQLHVHVLMGKLGLFRPRISVELVCSTEDGPQWDRVPCVYFERFKSGRLYVAGGR